MHPRKRPQSILNDPAVREFYALLEIARRQGHDEPTARRMVEAYYTGQLDRERIARLVAAA